MRPPGIEPGSQNWKSWMIAATQRALDVFLNEISIKLSGLFLLTFLFLVNLDYIKRHFIIVNYLTYSHPSV